MRHARPAPPLFRRTLGWMLLLPGLAAGLAGCGASGDPPAPAGAAPPPPGLSLALAPAPGDDPAPGCRLTLTDGNTPLAEADWGPAGARFTGLAAAAPILHIRMSALAADGRVDAALIRAAAAAGGVDPVYPAQCSLALPVRTRSGAAANPAPAAPEVDPYAWRGATPEPAAPAAAPARPDAVALAGTLRRFARPGAPAGCRLDLALDRNGNGQADPEEPVVGRWLLFVNETSPARDISGLPEAAYDADADGTPDVFQGRRN